MCIVVRKHCRFLATVFLSAILGSGCASTGTSSLSIAHDSASSASEDVFELNTNAQIAYKESRLIEAVQLYQQVVERVPSDAGAWFRLGNTYAQQGAYERAIHAYETSLINDSQQPKAWFNLSTAYLLNAQAAMRQSYDRMRPNDPARSLLDTRLTTLGQLLHGRIEESASTNFKTAQ